MDLRGLGELRKLDLSQNQLSSFELLDEVVRDAPRLLTLQLAGNPVCRNPKCAPRACARGRAGRGTSRTAAGTSTRHGRRERLLRGTRARGPRVSWEGSRTCLEAQCSAMPACGPAWRRVDRCPSLRPCVCERRYREQVIVMSDSVSVLDGQPVLQQQREVLMRLQVRKLMLPLHRQSDASQEKERAYDDDLAASRSSA